MANADIFNREAVIGEPFSSEDSELIFVGAEAQTLLVQQLNIRYRQNVTRTYEIGSPKQYFIAGGTEGDASLSRVIGPRPVAGAFMKQYGDVCNIQSNHITFVIRGDCGTSGGSLRVAGVVITQVAYQVQASDMVVNETVNMLVAKVEAA